MHKTHSNATAMARTSDITSSIIWFLMERAVSFIIVSKWLYIISRDSFMILFGDSAVLEGAPPYTLFIGGHAPLYIGLSKEICIIFGDAWIDADTIAGLRLIGTDTIAGGDVICVDTITGDGVMDTDITDGGVSIGIDTIHNESGSTIAGGADIDIDTIAGGAEIDVDTIAGGVLIDIDTIAGGVLIDIDTIAGGVLIDIDTIAGGADIDVDTISGGGIGSGNVFKHASALSLHLSAISISVIVLVLIAVLIVVIARFSLAWHAVDSSLLRLATILS
jgi:hypothetical protein